MLNTITQANLQLIRRLSLYCSPDILPRVSEEKIFKWSNQSEKICLVSLFLFYWDKMRNLCKGLSIDALNQVLIHFTKRVSERIFLIYQPMRKNHPWRPSIVPDHNKMRILYTGPSTAAPYQILFHLAKQFQRRKFLKYQPIRNKNHPC